MVEFTGIYFLTASIIYWVRNGANAGFWSSTPKSRLATFVEILKPIYPQWFVIEPGGSDNIELNHFEIRTEIKVFWCNLSIMPHD
jgi:hypothetical protein